MREPYTSITVYGTSALLVAGLVYGGFFYQADADVKTHVNSAEVRLRLAASMPEKDKAGGPLAVRADLIARAKAELEIVDQRLANYAPVGELRAFASYLEGRFEESAQAYAAARDMVECTPEMRESFRINEARMWRAAGKLDSALAALGNAEPFTEERRFQADFEKLRILFEKGSKDEARTLAQRLAASTDQNSSLRLEIGKHLELLQDLDGAERSYELARKENTEGIYALARLKLVRGAADKALDLLEECFKSDGGKAKGWVSSDLAHWQSVATEARFRKLMEAESSATPSGR